PDVSKIEVKAVLYDVLRDRRHALLPSEAAKVAAAYGISTCPIELADTPEAAAEIAENLGYPVVLKVASPEIVHKTDVGGVLIGLNNSEEVRKGFVEILNNVHGFFPDAPVYGVEVQKMMPRGIEVIIGMTRDIQFGPLIAFGMGGIYVNLLKDVSFRLAQGLTQEEIESMIKETKTYALLRGS
ncbi:MAG: acetate--CoA ligase family protein, partial [Clostridia bacterium]|nr:acetate--CoA ligase family protein [Clostridia bacterium]